ncbi:MAG: hypothetical protein C5B50_27105 [Verrucomicrobia bacterium]|nr:MAG: hypothetical protein C5B50_27105 [Verrucomicrobiota bacterium]
MVVELINTGSELMLGRVLNTHQQWLCRQLADQGWPVSRQVAVADTAHVIEQALKEALSRADLIITTGGLGPTSDDLTRDLVAQLLGKKLHEDATVVAHIRRFFETRKRPMPERTRVQAMVPEGAMVLENPNGTAPGLAMEVDAARFRESGVSEVRESSADFKSAVSRVSNPQTLEGVDAPDALERLPTGSRRHSRLESCATWLIMLPGPPRELRPMFTDTVLPLLRRVLPQQGPFVCHTLRTTGLGESLVQERIAEPLRELVSAGLDLGYCARPGQVDVRLAAQGAEAQGVVEKAERIVSKHLSPWIYATEEEELESVIIRLLTDRKETLALAESCTGGHIANRLTNVPGASAVLLAGLVTYSNAAKIKFLGVDAQIIERHGAVSEPVAREMAEGARREAGATYALSVTGIAGPSGGTAEKPMGTVFMGLAGPFETVVERQLNPYDRETFKQVTSQQAMEMLRRKLKKMAKRANSAHALGRESETI